jgi:hypothetical protein
MDSIQNWIDPIIMQLENATENSVSESDVADALEALLETDENRFEINSLTQEEAVGKLQLSEYQYYQLQLYIEKYGKLVSLYELAAVEGFTHADLLRLSNRLYISNRREKKSGLHHFFRKGASTLLLRYAQVLEKRAGFDKSKENRYLGSPPQLAFKYSYRAPNLIIGLSGEKDSGEPFFKGAQKWGFDHYAFYLGIKNISVIKCLLAGDYRLSFGQGLIMGSGLLGGKGSGSAAIRKMPSSIQPAATLNESDALRGAALHIGNAQYSAVLFYGFRQFDGRQDSLPDGEIVFEGALAAGGLHRTASEAAKKHALLSHTYGASLRMQQRIFRLSLQAVHTLFAQSIAVPDALYRKYNFNGINHFNVSIDYQVFIRKCILFGEAAVGNHGYPALLQGMSINLSPLVKVGALWRYYHRGYIALQGRAFGENGTNSGETGLYLTTDIVLGPKMECQLFSDLYRFTWLRYRTDKPAVGSDFGMRLSLEISRNCRFTVRYAYKNKAQNGGNNPYWHEIVNFNRHKARMAFVLTPLPYLSLHTEVNFAANHAPPAGYKKFGHLLFQDIALSWPKVNLQLHARIAYFNTDSYEERIYAYEHDLYYAFTIQGYYYQGWRACLMLRYNYRFFTIWLRLSQTRYLNRETIGSGLDLINRNHKTDVKVQVRFKF